MEYMGKIPVDTRRKHVKIVVIEDAPTWESVPQSIRSRHSPLKYERNGMFQYNVYGRARLIPEG